MICHMQNQEGRNPLVGAYVSDRGEIALAVREAEGNRAAAALRLGISVATINRRLRGPAES